MHYYEAGSGDNHTFLLHGGGFSVNADTFQFVFEPLAQHLHVYALDAFGHGRSDRQLEYGPTFDVVVDSMRELMDQLGLRQVNIVGHSFGGWSGGILAYESPDRVRRLVIIGGAGLNVTPVAGVTNQRVPTKESALRGIQNSIYEGSQMTQEIAEAMAEQIVRDSGGEAGMLGMKPHNDQMADEASRRQYLLHRRLPYIRVPSMVIWGQGTQGKPGDTMEPYPAWTEEYEKAGGDISKTSKPWVIPGAKYVMHQGTHNIHWEHPDQVVKMLVDFLK
jgi:2-hydroxy-6-oxonona-2,4-dienedioate hydrolase